MEKQANERDITGERFAYLDLEFTLTGDDTLVGKDIVFLTKARERQRPDQIILRKDQTDMSVDGLTASFALPPADTARAGKMWYEFWVDWGQGQWSKEFKGSITLTESIKYEE